MALFRHLRTLLAVSEATAEAQAGKTYAVLPSDGDGVGDHQQSWRAFIDISQSGGDTSPTTDCELQTSHDGKSWITAAKATQLTEDGEGHELKELSALGPYVRAVTTLGGGSAPNHKVTVKLASTGPFSTQAK
jgi:hypothetical protein